MRKILFRGKRIDDGKWVYGDLMQIPRAKYRDNPKEWNYDIWEISGSSYRQPVQYSTIGQYTGLTDKNGKKIFEGDIVQGFWCPTGEKVVGVVKYYERTVKYCICGNRIVGLSHCRNIEAIGNIHDNPELLEVGE